MRSVVPSPRRTSSTRPPADSTRARAASSAGASTIARRLQRPGGMPGIGRQRLRQRHRIGGHEARRRVEVGERSDHRQRLLEALEAGEQPVPVLARLEGDRGPGDDPGRAVVVEVQLGVVTLDVHEAGVGDGVHDVEGAHERAVAVQHAVADRAGAAGAAGQEPADRRAGRRRVHQDLLAGRLGGPLQLHERGAGIGGQRAVDDLDDRAGAGHVEDETAGHRDRLAVVAGALAARRDRHAVADGGADRRGDRRRRRAGRRRRRRARAAAAP